MPKTTMLHIILALWAVKDAPVLYINLFWEMCSLRWDTKHSFMLREQMQLFELQNLHFKFLAFFFLRN